MGRASTGNMFDPVAQAFIDLGADEQTKRTVLGKLLDVLIDNDWDTYDESLEEFRDDPVLVSLFYERGLGNRVGVYTEPEGVLGYDAETNEWTLTCGEGYGSRSRQGCGELARRDGSSAAGHNKLVRLWAEHAYTEHGGDGKVDRESLILLEAEEVKKAEVAPTVDLMAAPTAAFSCWTCDLYGCDC